MVLLLLLSGCALLSLVEGREAVSADAFADIARRQSFTVEQPTDATTLLGATDVREATKGSIEVFFAVMPDAADAERAFASLRSDIDQYWTGSGSQRDVNTPSFNHRSINTANLSFVVIRVDNTIFYGESTRDYRDEMSALVEAMGY